LDVVKYLVSEGANILGEDKFKQTPCMLAKHAKHNDIVKYLTLLEKSHEKKQTLKSREKIGQFNNQLKYLLAGSAVVAVVSVIVLVFK
jgi:ankyrin repeat protein